MYRFARAAAIPVAVLALAACGSSSDNGASSSSGSSAAAPADSSYPGKSAQQIMDAARKAADSARSVTVHGQTNSAGKAIVFDMARANGKGMDGKVTVAGAGLQLRQIGKITYAHVSPEFLAALGGMGASMGSAIGGKWLAADPNSLAAIAASTGGGILNAFQTYETAGSTLSSSVPANATLTRVAGKTFGGVQTTGVKFSAPMPADSAAAIAAAGGTAPSHVDGVVYVPVSGTPYPVAIESNAGVNVTLSKWDEPVKLVAPPKKLTISLAQLGMPGL